MNFAKLGINSKVTQVIAVNDIDCHDAEGNIDAEIGRQFLENLTGYPNWVMIKDTHETWGIGSTYLEDEDIFKPKQPYPSWSYNNATNKWEAPVSRPEDKDVWDEDNQTWVVSL